MQRLGDRLFKKHDLIDVDLEVYIRPQCHIENCHTTVVLLNAADS